MVLPAKFSLSISGICLQIDSDQRLEEHVSFLPFLTEQEPPDFRAIFRQVNRLPPLSENILHEDDCYRVHPDGRGGYVRSFFDAPRDMAPYAVAFYDHDNGIIQIDYLVKGAHCVSQLHNSFFHLGFEAILIHEDRLCLHASCVDTPLGGILFSGVSGIGKSTQADLWCKHRNAKQINGDRPILSKSQSGWLAWGSPYAGSSHHHVNQSCPVTAIVMLKQAKECTLRQLTQREAFRAIWSGLIMHSWDTEFVEKACNLAIELIDTVPVYEFSCTPDEQAVAYLEQRLGKECCL